MKRRSMSKTGVWLALMAFVLSAQPSPSAAQDLSERLDAEHFGAIETGTYEAGDVTFMLDHDPSHYLLRFAGQPEIYVLYADNASLGGRVLKYDSGKTVLSVTAWGGMTLYTDDHPGGLPVTRTGDSSLPPPPPVSLDALKAAALAASQMLASQRHLGITFEINAAHLADDAALRVQGLDAVENAATGISRYCASPAALKAISSHLHTVLVTTSGKPTLERKDSELVVTFNPAAGYAGRASSRAIARALQMIFHTP